MSATREAGARVRRRTAANGGERRRTAASGGARRRAAARERTSCQHATFRTVPATMMNAPQYQSRRVGWCSIALLQSWLLDSPRRTQLRRSAVGLLSNACPNMRSSSFSAAAAFPSLQFRSRRQVRALPGPSASLRAQATPARAVACVACRSRVGFRVLSRGAPERGWVLDERRGSVVPPGTTVDGRRTSADGGCPQPRSLAALAPWPPVLLKRCRPRQTARPPDPCASSSCPSYPLCRAPFPDQARRRPPTPYAPARRRAAVQARPTVTRRMSTGQLLRTGAGCAVAAGIAWWIATAKSEPLDADGNPLASVEEVRRLTEALANLAHQVRRRVARRRRLGYCSVAREGALWELWANVSLLPSPRRTRRSG